MGQSYSSTPCRINKEQFDKIVMDISLELGTVSMEDVRNAINYACNFNAPKEHMEMLLAFRRKLEAAELRELRNLEN